MRFIDYVVMIVCATLLAVELDRMAMASRRPTPPRNRAPIVRPVSTQRWVF